MPHVDAQIVRLYDTVFDRAPDAEGSAFWNRVADAGHGLDYMAERFMVAAEFATTYGQPDSLSFVRSMYQNILDRGGEAEGVAFWAAALDEGRADRSDVVVQFSESPEHIARMAANAVRPPAAIFGSNLGGVLDGTGAGERIVGVTYDQMTSSGPPNFTPGVVIPELSRGGGPDTLSGHGGNDTLEGAGGGDFLFGGAGDDVLIGGRGMDHLYGGEGADIFRFEAVSDAADIPLRDFQAGVDRLDVSGLGLAYRGTGGFVADGQAQLRWALDDSIQTRMLWKTGPSSLVLLDADGDGVSDMQLLVVGQTLTDGGFLL